MGVDGITGGVVFMIYHVVIYDAHCIPDVVCVGGCRVVRGCGVVATMSYVNSVTIVVDAFALLSSSRIQ